MAPGRKTGGRQLGTPNKASQERALIAQQVKARADMAGRKLAKEVLDEFMHLFAGMAAAYQPLPPGTIEQEGREPDEAKFEKWARLAIQCAKELAAFQSPTFRAIAIASGGGDGELSRLSDAELVAELARQAKELGVEIDLSYRIGQ